jgi:uncharacterized protein (UPF0332 family)
MKPTSSRFFQKAARALASADLLARDGDHETAVARAYYAMFYAASALLHEKGLRFRKHGGVHGAFGEHFVKTGLLDAKYHRWLLEAFNRRIAADYDAEPILMEPDARVAIPQAREFVDAARQYIEEHGESDSPRLPGV